MPASTPSPPLANAAAGTPSLRKLGSGSTDAAPGDDARFLGVPSSASYDSGSSKIPVSDSVTGRISASYLPDSGATPGTYALATVSVDKHGRVTAVSAGSVTPKYQTVQSPSGTALTQRDVLALAARLSASDGGGATIIDFADSGVTPTTYTSANVTVDRYGRVTAASNGAAFPSVNGGFEGVYEPTVWYAPGTVNIANPLSLADPGSNINYTYGHVFGVSGTITNIGTAFAGPSGTSFISVGVYRSSANRHFPGSRIFSCVFTGSRVITNAWFVSCSLSVAVGELIWFWVNPSNNIGGNQAMCNQASALYPILGTSFNEYFIGSAQFSSSFRVGYRNSGAFVYPMPDPYPAASSSHMVHSHGAVGTCLFKFSPG